VKRKQRNQLFNQKKQSNMSMYNILFGIEANSQKEAEQKALKFQQIVSEHEPKKEQQKDCEQKKGLMPSPYSEIIGFIACVGLLRLNAWVESRKPKEDKEVKKFKTFKQFKFEKAMERRRNARQEQKNKLTSAELK
jgi:hypothetical protein